MKLKGDYRINTSPEKLWDLCMDPEALTRFKPGIKRLEKNGQNKYTTLSEIKIGPVKGAFKGELEIIDQVPPSKFTLVLKQRSKIGNINANGFIYLKNDSSVTDMTEVHFEGEVKISGLLARTGQRVMGAVAKTLTDEFFNSLSMEI